MFEIHKSGSLGKADYGWLKPRYHFSFSNYYNPKKMGLGSLRVLNDDLIYPGKGFDIHPHKDMEIITYIINGEITHKDSMGNARNVSRGSMQYMSAGTGVTHSEFNNGKDILRVIQIWIEPTDLNLTPNYGDIKFTKEDRHNKLLQLVSSKENNGKIKIYQDANIFVSEADSGHIQEFRIGDYDYIYFVQLEGESLINLNKLEEGDALTTSESILIEPLTYSHFLIVQIRK